jgi:hypothetical protein
VPSLANRSLKNTNSLPTSQKFCPLLLNGTAILEYLFKINGPIVKYFPYVGYKVSFYPFLAGKALKSFESYELLKHKKLLL